MSSQASHDPECNDCDDQVVKLTIDGREKDIGAFTVRRVLPSRLQRLVGPFIFFDHMGPAEIPPGAGMDVRPHPHINLSTVTYMFDGHIVHRDSLGSHQTISPGAVNWMTAGKGITHSERSRDEDREVVSKTHGIQLWIALPKEHEETEPEFHHHPAATLPRIVQEGDVQIHLLCGKAYGVTSPVKTFSPMYYAEARIPAGGSLRMPEEYEERAVYVVDGEIACGDESATSGRMLVFKEGTEVVVQAQTAAHLMLLGGDKLDGERHIFWNFISSRKERLEEAKSDWKEGRFPKVPGDDKEFIPLPE